MSLNLIALVALVACDEGNIMLPNIAEDNASSGQEPRSSSCPDRDGDGYLDASCGGDDCWDDPSSPPAEFIAEDGSYLFIAAQVNPGAEEVWYDGMDRNCDGNDADQDGDGEVSCAVGGSDLDDDGDGAVPVNQGSCPAWPENFSGTVDCDDTDAAVHPGAPEDNTNGFDDNCDGLVDGFEVQVEWSLTFKEGQYVGTLEIKVNDDNIDDLKIYLGGEEIDIPLINHADKSSMFHGRVEVVRVGDVRDPTQQIALDGQGPEDVTFLYQSANGIASLGTYTNDRNTPDTSDDLEIPVGCAVWGPNPEMALAQGDSTAWHCMDVTSSVEEEGNGNWFWDGLL